MPERAKGKPARYRRIILRRAGIGFGGKLLFLATTGAVFLAGAKMLDCLKLEKEVADLRAQMSEPAE